MSDTIIIEVIKSLEGQIRNLATDVGKTHTDLALIKQTLERVEGQTVRTNGRVTKLEDMTNKLTENNLTLTAMFSKQNGIYEQNLLKIEERICTRGAEIDELKKKVNISSVGELDIKKINTDYSGRIKLAVVAGVISILTISATALLSFRAGENKVQTLPDVTNIINK